VGSFVQFSVGVSSTVDSVAFTVNDVAGGNPTIGTITSEGLYQAPATVPANTTITVKVTASNSQTGTSASATGTVTLDSGVRVSIVPSTFIIGTGETFTFVASVTGVPATAAISGVCDSDPNTGTIPCTSVTWSVSGSGTIDPSSGLYTAPSATGSATITATSVYDTTRTATASVTIVTAADPTLTSISNTVGAVGAFFQDIYLTGSDFISTTEVLVNGAEVTNTTRLSSTVLRVRLGVSADFQPDDILAAPDTLTFTVRRQNGSEKSCSDAAQCQLVLTVRRPAVVGASPDTIPQGSSPTVNINGGYFGTTNSSTVTTSFGGQADAGTVTSPRQISVAVGSADTAMPGLVPVTVASNTAGVPPAVVNVAVQPVYSSPPSAPTTVSVGTQPSAVAINTATGIAVVANQGSHSITLIDLASPSPPIGFICTASQGATLSVAEPMCAASGPTSVAVDNLRNLALVANSATQTVAVVSLTTGAESVTAIIPAGSTSIADVPLGVGINPLTGLAVVAYQTAGFASIIDLKLPTPAVTGLVTVNTGAEPRVAVSPKLNWALITPGGGGSGTLNIVDLSRQNVNSIASTSCDDNVDPTPDTVTITTTLPHTLSQNDRVLIIDVVGGSGFNGVFGVTSVSGNTFMYSPPSPGCSGTGTGGTAHYARPVAQVTTSASVTGVAINEETQRAILVSETGTQARIFSLLDQTSTTVTGLASVGAAAAAFNPLANIAVVVNRINNDASVIDPGTPSVLSNSTFSGGLNEPVDVAIDPGTNRAVIVNRSGNNVSIFSLSSTMRSPQVLQIGPDQATISSTLTSAAVATDQAVTIIGSGFVSGTSVVRLDGTGLATTFLSSRQLTATVPAATLTAGGARRYALDVANGTDISNAAIFSVIQNVDVSSSCSPQGVAIDSRRNLAVVTNPGCNSVALVNLATGMGSTVQVGTNPQGVAVHTQSGRAVVANQGSGNASIIDVVTPTEVTRLTTNSEPVGVAIDPGLDRAVVTASAANVIDTFTVPGDSHTVTSLAVQARPAAVAVNPDRHLAAVANTTSNTVSLVDLTQAAATENISANGLPAGTAFDPVSTAFLTAVSLNNQILILDPVSRTTSFLRVGVNPTSIAYNFASSTLVTTNSASQTMTVVDFLSLRPRAVLGRITPSGQFAVDIHPFTNLAVVADSANHRVLLVPLLF
jgi:DNA-binding beta-propeller fold protein YncE